MFSLRVYSEVGSIASNKGISKSIVSHGTKKQMIVECKKQMLKSEVIRIKDNKVVFTNK